MMFFRRYFGITNVVGTIMEPFGIFSISHCLFICVFKSQYLYLLRHRPLLLAYNFYSLIHLFGEYSADPGKLKVVVFENSFEGLLVVLEVVLMDEL